MKHRLSRIEFVLPRWDEGEMDPEFVGKAEVGAFCRSGDPWDLPENPSVGMALEWILRIARGFGFERELARLGTDHQTVMDCVFMPVENGKFAHLANTHPLILMHCLWRMTVYYGRQQCVDMTVPIAGDTMSPDSHFWSAFLERIREKDIGLVFLPNGTLPEWGPEVQLGNPNLNLDPREMSPGIARVFTEADFSELPEEPDWKEITDLSQMIDGYTLAESLPEVGDLFEWFNQLWQAHLEEGEAFPHSSVHLWLMLFACQRDYLRDIWDSENADGSPSIYAIGMRNLYLAFRWAVQDEQRHPDAGTPLYLRARPR